VLCTVLAAARLEVANGVVGWLALAENMPGGSAMRPSDVVTIYGGTTVEVLDTDAEGRLVMADAIVRAAEESPDLIIDVATLTGAQGVPLGAGYAAVLANDDGLREQILAAARETAELMWPFPLDETLRGTLDSRIADLRNVGDDSAGKLVVSALFLAHFVPPGTPWAHLDIAGPGSNRGDATGYTPPGATGAYVRTLVRTLESLSR
jgi:leucyl aminopeptidase